MADSSDRLDVTEVHCRDKHGKIMARWNALVPGQSFVLVNGHDPLPLYYQFQSQFPGEFDWVYEERGPSSYAIRITRLADGQVATADPATIVVAARPSCVVPGAAPSAPAGIDVDARGLQPPEPMMRILGSLETLPAGQECRALTDRRPIHLVPMLEAKGFVCASEERPDGSWINFIRRA